MPNGLQSRIAWCALYNTVISSFLITTPTFSSFKSDLPLFCFTLSEVWKITTYELKYKSTRVHSSEPNQEYLIGLKHFVFQYSHITFSKHFGTLMRAYHYFYSFTDFGDLKWYINNHTRSQHCISMVWNLPRFNSLKLFFKGLLSMQND